MKLLFLFSLDYVFMGLVIHKFGIKECGSFTEHEKGFFQTLPHKERNGCV